MVYFVSTAYFADSFVGPSRLGAERAATHPQAESSKAH